MSFRCWSLTNFISLTSGSGEKISVKIMNWYLFYCLLFSELKQNWSKPFGGVSILIFGDPLQLRPINASFPWERPINQKHRNAHLLRPLWDLFEPVLLRTNHRQGQDLEYSILLEKIRTGKAGEEEFEILKKRVYKRTDDKIPSNCVSIYSNNQLVNLKNNTVLDSIEGTEFTSEMKIRHNLKCLEKYTPFVENAGNVRNTQLQKTLKLWSSGKGQAR